MKSVFLTVFAASLLTTFTLASAELISHDQAGTVAQTFIGQRQALGDSWAGSTADGDIQALKKGERKLGYYQKVAPRGFIVISLLRELPAIKAFSATTDLDPLSDEGMAGLLKDTMAATLEFLEDEYGDLDQLPATVAPMSNRGSWNALLAGETVPPRTEQVGPLLTAVWNQSAPYNNDCPPGDGGTCVVGCVATAAAQIMHYWKWPETGSGSHSYLWDGDDSCGGQAGGGTLSAVFEDSYDWDNILDSYSGGYSPEEAAAAAELNYEVAVAFDMDFGVCGSGTYVYIGETLYPEYFRYSEIIDFQNRNQHTADSWWDLILHEMGMDPPRPAQYRISGHSIVMDGCLDDGTRYYHMNYGWGGGANAWYALDNVYCPWEGCSYLVEAMLIGIEPTGYFTVTAPNSWSVWHHGDSGISVEWWGSDADSVRIDLFQGDEFIATFSGWTPNDGYEELAGEVPLDWGTGTGFRVKILGNDSRFGWSDEFGIFGEDNWVDAGGAPIDDGGDGQGIAWGDYDGDGDEDLYLANSASANKLFGNDGETFIDATVSPLDDVGYGRAVAWADMDNDGDLDLFLSNTSGGRNHIFRNEGGGFTDISGDPVGGDSYSLGGAWGDYDNDGLIDLFVANVYAPDQLLRNDGLAGFVDATAYPLGDGGYGRSPSWVDYDLDGDQDLFLVRQQVGKFYRNDGDGTFTSVSLPPLTSGQNNYGAAWADFDNDGDLDVYLANEGSNSLLANGGDGTFSDITTGPLGEPSVTRAAAWGDADNDGDPDLYLVSDEANQLLRNEGGGLFVDVTPPVLGDTSPGRGVAWADYDLDGDLDLYLSNAGQANHLFRNEGGSGNHWLRVGLVGDDSNGSGIGARVRVVAGGLSQVQVVGLGASSLSQNSLFSFFGLGANESVDSLQVIWPAGEVQTRTGLAADQSVTLFEGSTASGQAPDQAAARLLGSYPNPFNPSCEIALTLGGSSQASLTILDTSGRLVRALPVGNLGRGTHRISWDGLDARGRPVGSGVYLARLEDGGRPESLKLLLMK